MDMITKKEFLIGVAVGYLVLGRVLKYAQDALSKAKSSAPQNA
jgi:hypothetical protein